MVLAKESTDADRPFANLLPLVDALVDSGNVLLEGGFVLAQGGWECRFARPLDFDLIEKGFQLPENIQLSPAYDTVHDRLSWCVIEGPSALHRVDCHAGGRETASFDPETGSLRTWMRTDADIGEPDGRYKVLDGIPVVLYRHLGRLCLRVGDRVESFDSVRIAWRMDGDEVVLHVAGGGWDREIQYADTEADAPDPDYDWTVHEREDGDFGLFLTHVAQDRARQDRLYRGGV